MSTRRVHKRQLLLRPDNKLNRAVEYILAVLIKRHGLSLHAICVMGNHKHDVTTDHDGTIVDFWRDFHSTLTRYLNCVHGEHESMWSGEQTNRVECVEAADIVYEIAYTMANPVEARLVKRGRSWPGVRRAWPAPPKIVQRPPEFFRDQDAGGQWPKTAELVMSRPPGFDDMSDDELAAFLAKAIEEREQHFRDKAKREGKGFLGRRGVLKQSRYSYPASTEERFGIRPTVAAKNKWARIETLARNKIWDEDYDACLTELRAGNRNIPFPPGTFKLRAYYKLACRPPPL